MAKKLVKLGADPEFAFSKEGQLVAARGLVRDGDGEFGTDGNSDIAELRPKAAFSARGLVANIEKLIQDEVAANRRLLDHVWEAGPSYEGNGLGGHIHFGMPRDMAFVNMLDVVLAFPLMRVDDPVAARARKRSYGHLSDTETKPWGFEYRSLSTWLSSKKKALAVLTVAQIMARIWTTDRALFGSLYVKFGGPLTPEERAAYQRHTMRAVNPRIAVVLAELTEMLTWPSFDVVGKADRRFLGHFIDMCRNSTRDGAMKWELDNETLNARWAAIETAQVAAETAARVAREAREAQTASIVFPDSMTVRDVFTHPATRTPVTVRGMSFNAGDDRLSDIFEVMSGVNTATATSARRVGDVIVNVYGLLQTRHEAVNVVVGDNVSSANIEWMRKIGARFEVLTGYNVVIVYSASARGVSVGLRRDVRNSAINSRAVVIALMLAANNRISGLGAI